jgi:tetratricopeptide (TPR) repeat protein
MNAPTAAVRPPDPAIESRLRRLLQRGETYLAAGQRDAAAASFNAALELAPGHAPVLLQLAEMHLAAGRDSSARQAISQAASTELDSPRTALQLIRALSAISESAMIVDLVRQLPPPMWDSAQSLAEVAFYLSLVGAHPQALEYARAGVARDPRHPPSLYMQAKVEVFFGNLQAAAELAERCLAILPGDPGTWLLVSRLRLPDPAPRIDRLRALVREDARGDDAAMLANALHNELHELRDYPAAWRALEQCCRAKRAVLDYSVARNAELFAALEQWQSDPDAGSQGCDDPSLTPIFVVGMHRSGTTLAERIIAGHSQVAAGGETYDIRSQLRRASGLHFHGDLDIALVEGRDRLDHRRIGEGFLHGIRWRSGGKPFVTDKLPSNFLNIGFIARALPRARIINLVRDPIDVGLSNLRTLFSDACPYSYDQLEFADYFRRHRALMAHWHRVLPGRILDVAYDDLVNAPTATATRMAGFCGLEFEPAMLTIDRDDAVSTASSVMMRDGIRRDRGKLWKVYEDRLQPMIDALAD